MLELTTGTLNYDFQMELLRRFTKFTEDPNWRPDDDLSPPRQPDPDRD